MATKPSGLPEQRRDHADQAERRDAEHNRQPLSRSGFVFRDAFSRTA